MIIFMFWLIFCDKEGIGDIFIAMNDSSFFWTSKPNFMLFAVYNMCLNCLEMYHGSSKTA